MVYIITIKRDNKEGKAMTKKEHEAIQKEFNRLSDYRAKANEAFVRLQELNAEEGTGRRYCSAEQNYKELLSVGKDYTFIYNDYVKANGMEMALTRLGTTLAELNFWK